MGAIPRDEKHDRRMGLLAETDNIGRPIESSHDDGPETAGVNVSGWAMEGGSHGRIGGRLVER